MKGYQNIIGKVQMLQYNNHYNFIHLVLRRIRYTFSIVKSSQKKRKEKVKQHRKITKLYLVQCRVDN